MRASCCLDLPAEPQSGRQRAPTADPVLLSKSAIAALEPELIDGVPYARAGVMLTGLSPADAQPAFDTFASVHERRNIGEIMGAIKNKYGATSIGLGRAGMMEAPTGPCPANTSRRATPPNGPTCRCSGPASTAGYGR